MNLSLRRSLVLGLAAVLLASLLPAAWWLDRAIRHELEARAREDLALAPMRLADRDSARADALMMHAQEAARLPGLVRALADGDLARARAVVEAASRASGELPALADRVGRALLGPAPDPAMWAGIEAGHMPVAFLTDSTGALYVASFAPVMDDGVLVGAAGVSAPMDQVMAATLAGLTASEVSLVGRDGRVIASTLADTVARALAAAAGPGVGGGVREAAVAGGRYWLISAPLGGVARAVFAVDAGRELAVLPRLRRGAAVAGGLGLVLALLLGALMATALVRPVGSLAEAADRMAQGDFDAPLPRTRLPEVARVARAFERMRGALAARLAELEHANAELEQRERRLRALQSEMIQRDRLAAAGRLLAELAHEIRNPVANVRNCLEVIHRGSAERPELRRFADLAIDELLRMHELAEQMLDLNRPIDPGAARCDAADVVERVAALLSAGEQGSRWPTTTRVRRACTVSMAPDVLKQVLLSLVQNAREAMPDGGAVQVVVAPVGAGFVRIDVMDEGPGIDAAVLPRVFDPFFSTKDRAQGVGLGLFIAEGLVRRSGGRLAAANREDGAGARFTIELPTATSAEQRQPTGEAPPPPGEARPRGRRGGGAKKEEGA